MCGLDLTYVLEKSQKRFRSECSVMKEELKALLDSLGQNVCIYLNTLKRSLKGLNIQSTIILQDSNFIRCIKPNDLQKSGFFDQSFVAAQLQNSGTAYLIENEENVKIRE